MSLILTSLFVVVSMGFPFGSVSGAFARAARSIGMSKSVATTDTAHTDAPNQSANDAPKRLAKYGLSKLFRMLASPEKLLPTPSASATAHSRFS